MGCGAHLVGNEGGGLNQPHRRLASRILAELRSGEAADFDAVRLTALETDLERLADGIAVRYFPAGPNALRPEKLTGLA